MYVTMLIHVHEFKKWREECLSVIRTIKHDCKIDNKIIVRDLAVTVDSKRSNRRSLALLWIPKVDCSEGLRTEGCRNLQNGTREV